MPHIVLLLLIPREDADLRNVGGQEAAQNGVPEGACPAGNQERLILEGYHLVLLLCVIIFWKRRLHAGAEAVPPPRSAFP